MNERFRCVKAEFRVARSIGNSKSHFPVRSGPSRVWSAKSGAQPHVAGEIFDGRGPHALRGGSEGLTGGVKSLEADRSETAREAFPRAGSRSVQIGEDGRVSLRRDPVSPAPCG